MQTSIIILLSSLAVGQYRVERVGEPRQTGPYVVERIDFVAPPDEAPEPRPAVAWSEAVARAKKERRALLAGVGCEPPQDPAWLAVRLARLEGHREPCLSLWAFHGGWLHHVADLPPGFSQFEVWRELRDWQAPVADEEREAVRRGVLPKSLERWHPYAAPGAQERLDAQRRIRRQS